MLLRPFTISGTANLLLYFYVSLFLIFRLAVDYPTQRRLTRGLAYIMLTLTVMTLHQHFLVLSSNSLVDATRYLRNILAISLYWMSIRWIYLLTGEWFSAEKSLVNRTLFLFLIAEFVYTAQRLLRAPSLTEVAARPVIMQLPMLLTGLWVFTLTMRSILAAEHASHRPSWQKVLRPQSDIGLMLRQMSLAVALAIVVMGLYVTQAAGYTDLRFNNLSDILIMFATIMMAFAYMRYHLTYVNLGMRVIAVGLAIFLSLISFLGWIISARFLELMLPNVSQQQIVGSILDTFHTVDPVYLPTLQQLNRLLAPIFWFSVIGSLIYVVVFHLYYRLRLQPSITTILSGIDQVEQGDLRYRLPELYPDEFGRIAIAFNQMAHSLDSANDALNQHQMRLEGIVASRTNALRDEIEQRKERELHIALHEERERFARETHDGILQTLFSVRMRLRSRRLRQAQSTDLTRDLDELSADILDCSHELRQIIDATSVDWQSADLTTTLATLIDRFNKSFPIHAILDSESVFDHLPPEKQKTIFRVVQEALSNAARHSGAKTVCVSLAETRTQLVICIADDGCGIARATSHAANAHGLRNMHDRALTAGGTLSITPNQPTGTRVELIFPR